MGGDLVIDPDAPLTQLPGTDLVGGLERLPHVEDLLPDICTLDCGSLNFGDGSNLYVSTPDMLRAGARRIQELGVRPELEIFDTGQLWFAKQLLAEGLLDDPTRLPAVHGHPVGRARRPGRAPVDGRHAARGRAVGELRARPDADALGRPVDPARRQRPGRPGGQPLPQQGRQGHQRASSSSVPCRSPSCWAPGSPPRTRPVPAWASSPAADRGPPGAPHPVPASPAALTREDPA